MDTEKRAYPNVKAVDPYSCICTECAVYDHVAERFWVSYALPADIKAFIRGDIKNNTNDTVFWVVCENYYEAEETQIFIQKLKERVAENFLEIELENL